ncbi:hypothetical protein [Oceanobacillus sp. CFH 90083]|uniref:hypothetical protein n=1 Tax=Oceanobacillus sp. CFH 90083 TaxID=2592336 RepID=UPI00128B1951|nr:hypothetical protein [Oceanobacillus sp. CFH 90083]
MNFLNGKYLEGQELVEVKKRMLEKEKVKTLFNELSQGLDVTLNDLAVQSYAYDFAGTGNEIFIAKTTKLFIEDHLNIVVTEGVYDDSTIEVVVGDKLAEEEGEVVFKEYEFIENEVVLVEETAYTEQLQKEIAEAAAEDGLLPNEASYVPGETAVQIQPQGVFDFCLPGGYKWCGKGCGYQTGGGTPANGVDRCCKTHDDCYRKNKSSRCSKCDRPLINCVKKQKGNNIAKSSIYAFFTAKCNFIIV